MKRTTLRNWLIVATVTWGIAAPVALLAVLFSAFLFDAPGAERSVRILALVAGLLLFPVACIAGTAASWLFFARGRGRQALYSALLPLVPLLLVAGSLVVTQLVFGGSFVDAPEPLPEEGFDVVSMFSVMTHQYPDDARHILALLRRYVRPAGHLFVTCFLDAAVDAFEDRSPERNGGRCLYNPDFLAGLLRQAGWVPVARHAAEPPLIGDSFVARPTPPAGPAG